MSAHAALAAAAPTWQELWRALPAESRDCLRWFAGSDDPAAVAAWRRWVGQSLATTPAPLLISPASRR